MENLQTGNYKALAVSLTIPSILVFLNCLFFISDSVFFFVLEKGQFNIAEEIFNKVGNQNHQEFDVLNSEEKI